MENLVLSSIFDSCTFVCNRVLTAVRLSKVRMDALGLLCETHRRTEGVSPQEFELLRHFLPPNVNCQPPGVRQLTVSLLKRVSGFTKIYYNHGSI